MVSQSYVPGYVSKEVVDDFFAAGATGLAIFVNIDTDDKNNNMYGISIVGKNGENFVGAVTAGCPTPCPTGTGHQP